MGNRSSSVGPSEALLVSKKKISVREEIINRKNKTKTGFVVIIAMCCTTVINTLEPDMAHSGQHQEPHCEPYSQKQAQSLPPRKPLNSRPRVRSYGYRVTRVAPLILAVDGLEDSTNPKEKVSHGEELSKAQLVAPEEKEVNFDSEPKGEIENAIVSKDVTPSTEQLSRPVILQTEEKTEKVNLTWTERLRKETEEKIVKDQERCRARSAMMNTIAINELQRRKHLQAKTNRGEERRRQRNFQALAPITEDREGEEIEREKNTEWHPLPPPDPTPLGSRRSSVAPIVIKNRLQKRLIRKDLYFKAIQELLEIGDAYRVSRELTSIISDSDDEEEDDLYDHFPFPNKLMQRKMSLAGILEQSAAERAGFAALLAHKLSLLLMEDEIESEASYVPGQERRRSCSDSAPACLAMVQLAGPGDISSWEDSLTIFNESDSYTGNSRGISQPRNVRLDGNICIEVGSLS